MWNFRHTEAIVDPSHDPSTLIALVPMAGVALSATT